MSNVLTEIIIKLIKEAVGFFTAFFMGRGYEKSKQVKKEVQAHEKRAEIENNIVHLDDHDRMRLRDKWSR